MTVFIRTIHKKRTKKQQTKKVKHRIKFKVEQFTIQLNKSETNSQLAKFRINKVKAYVESRPDFLKSNGKLGSLVIYDISEHNGLYVDRFLTSGKQALEFEFFKHIGPLDLLDELHDFDIYLKLNMSSVKYVHTQRFIVSLTSYFQQFNQLQEALGKMRALSVGQTNIAYTAQRSSRIKLDIQTEAPIIVIPLNNKSTEALVFNLGNIEVKNKFLVANELINHLNSTSLSEPGSANSSFSFNEDERDCLLDLIDIKFTDTHLYSAQRYSLTNEFDLESVEEIWTSLDSSDGGLDLCDLKFFSFGFKQTSKSILKQQDNIYFHLERNLENELSHKSPDWFVYSKLSSILVSIDLDQYKLIRGILDQNIGEQIKQNLSPANFIIPNANLETVLTGKVWKQISINFDLENVAIELFNQSSLAILSLNKSSLIYEAFSDSSKLVDLVSNEISVMDSRGKVFYNILNKKSTQEQRSKRLQLEIHYRSNKTSNRYSILFNNCQVITLIDWLMQIKAYLLSYSNPNDSVQIESSSNEQPIEIKVNLTNTDFVLVENIEIQSSQAIILRLTAFLEYNQRKMDSQPIESCLQSLELFSCQMNAIEQTALSIIDPVKFSIYLKRKNSNNFSLEISSEQLRLRFSYLDFKLFIKVLKSVQKQIEQENKILNTKPISQSSINRTNKIQISDLNIWIISFSICLIDDCNDLDVPLSDIQFNRFSLSHQLVDVSLLSGQGSVEFVLNVDYYNRLLSGWEPLIEPWLARLNWKFKPTSNVYTLTSMDVLNLNLTNPFIQIVTGTLANWKKDLDSDDANLRTKIHKVFQPYKLVNHTGQSIKFSKYFDSDLEWQLVEDKSEKEFNFVKIQNSIYAQRTHNNQLRKLAQNKIRIKLDEWSEIKPLTIDKVGTYFREVYRISANTGPSMTRLIFDISLKENATKIIQIKSPVTIKNRLNFKIECKIQSCSSYLNSKLGPLYLELDKDGEKSVPIKYLPCNVWFRPIEMKMNREAEFSSCGLNLSEINQPGQVEYTQLTCKVTYSNEKQFVKSVLDSEIFYFFAKTKTLHFPSHFEKANQTLHGHSIFVEPAFSLYNLLPVEFRYKFVSVSEPANQNADLRVLIIQIYSFFTNYFQPNKFLNYVNKRVYKNSKRWIRQF